MTETKKRGRPKKVAAPVEPKNPDCDNATRGFVKCMLRKYHANQTIKNMEHRRFYYGGLTTYAWLFFAAVAYGVTILADSSGRDLYPFDTAAVVCLLLAMNAFLSSCGYFDAIRCSEQNLAFVENEPEPKPKTECGEE